MATYVLVSCGKEKLSYAAPAKDLYTSQLFRKSRAWAERSGHPWFILSAKHGLVHPDTVLEPYDVSLESFGKEKLLRWGEGVSKQLVQFTRKGDTLIFLAGGKYLAPAAFMYADVLPAGDERYAQHRQNADVKIVQPMEGMQIGQRLSWLTKQLSEPAARPVNRLCPVTWRT